MSAFKDIIGTTKCFGLRYNCITNITETRSGSMNINNNNLELDHGRPHEYTNDKIEWGRPDLNWSTRLPKPEGWTKLPHGPKMGKVK